MNRSIDHITEFRFVGMSRSGNHAVINWIINQLPGRYCFLNCAEPKHNPFATARPLSEGGKTYKTNIRSFDLKDEQQGKFSEKDYLLYSYEDSFLGSLNHPSFKKNRDRWVGRAAVLKTLLILRDPFNLFASRIKSNLLLGHYTYGTKPISLLALKRIYKQHAREFLGEKKNLKNRVPVNFNSWATNKTYRRSIMEQLDVPFSDKGFQKVSKVAGGSSFDGLELSEKANEMQLQSRWKEFAADERFWKLFDAELADVTRKIFGDIPPLRFYIKHKKQDKKQVR
ncbi:MAG: hypothetical protein WD317_11600 [Balneolaceae bacterium]